MIKIVSVKNAVTYLLICELTSKPSGLKQHIFCLCVSGIWTWITWVLCFWGLP